MAWISTPGDKSRTFWQQKQFYILEGRAEQYGLLNYPIYDQNLRSYLWSDQKFDNLFMTGNGCFSLCVNLIQFKNPRGPARDRGAWQAVAERTQLP